MSFLFYEHAHSYAEKEEKEAGLSSDMFSSGGKLTTLLDLVNNFLESLYPSMYRKSEKIIVLSSSGHLVNGTFQEQYSVRSSKYIVITILLISQFITIVKNTLCIFNESSFVFYSSIRFKIYIQTHTKAIAIVF